MPWGSLTRCDADANEARDWRIYAELAQRLIVQARRLYTNEDLGFDLANTVYALELDDHRSLSGRLSVGWGIDCTPGLKRVFCDGPAPRR